jgi:uncharacterized protein
MPRIGLLSDTHGYFDERLLDHFADCDELWHAGDVGSAGIISQLEAFRPLRVVSGNIDGREVRQLAPENLHFECGGLRVWMTHIGGFPPRYNPQVRPQLQQGTPDIFVCGHSHILRVMRDPKLRNLLYLNPGAAGREGFHKIRTALRFTIDQKTIHSMEVLELGLRGALS